MPLPMVQYNCESYDLFPTLQFEACGNTIAVLLYWCISSDEKCNDLVLIVQFKRSPLSIDFKRIQQIGTVKIEFFSNLAITIIQFIFY